MVPTEYTDRILPGEAIYLAPNGRFHRAGCRYYVAPAADAVFVEGTFTQAFLDNHCKLCFPDGVPAGVQVAAPTPLPMPVTAPPAPPATEPAAVAPEPAPATPAPAAPTQEAAELPPLPPPITIPDEEPHRVRKRKRHRETGRPMSINPVQIAVFAAIVVLSVGLFVGLALLLNWFG